MVGGRSRDLEPPPPLASYPVSLRIWTPVLEFLDMSFLFQLLSLTGSAIGKATINALWVQMGHL